MVGGQDWIALAGEIRRVNEANGFDKPAWANLATKLMLVVTELDEAVDGSGKGNQPSNLQEELADTAIRLIDILAAVYPGSWTVRARGLGTPYQPIEVLLWPVLGRCAKAVEAWRKDESESTRIWIEYALAETIALADTLRFDLYAIAVAKVAKNAERGRLHGKARSD